MTQKEIDQKLKEGAEMIMFFGLLKSLVYINSNSNRFRITEKQFQAAKKRHEGNMILHCNSKGLTQHIYKLKIIP